MFTRRKSPEVLIAAIALAIAACWLPIRMRFPFDDTYITFRYAANVAHGFGIVWNPGGAHTEGYTNFLFVLLLAPFSAMGWDLVVVSQAIGVIAVVISAIAIWKITNWMIDHPELRITNERSSLDHFVGVFAVALFLLDPFTWFNSYSGMETSLFTMWVLLALWAVGRGRPTDAFAMATLATLTRPEGALMGMILLGVLLFSRSANTKVNTRYPLPSTLYPFLAVFVLPLAIYAGWKLWYFGNLLPNSFYIKVAQAQGATFLPGRGTIRIFYEGVWYLLPLAFLALWKEKKNPIVLVAAWWCFLLSAFYLFSYLLMNFYERFTNSIETTLIVMAAIGVARVAAGRRRVWIIVLASFLLLLHVAWSLFMREGIGYLTRGTVYENSSLRIAPVLRSIPDHEHIMLAWADAGILPYYSGLRNLDLVGLNTNEIAHAHSSEEVIRYIIRAKPDLLIIPLMLPKEDTIPNDTSRRIFREGHGLIGSAYPALAREALASTYKPIALLPQNVYDLDLLADTTSPHYRDIVNTIAPRIGRDPNFLPPIESIR